MTPYLNSSSATICELKISLQTQSKFTIRYQKQSNKLIQVKKITLMCVILMISITQSCIMILKRLQRMQMILGLQRCKYLELMPKLHIKQTWISLMNKYEYKPNHCKWISSISKTRTKNEYLCWKTLCKDSSSATNSQMKNAEVSLKKFLTVLS